MLRYFYEKKPDVAVIAAGSLLEIVLHKEEVSFPVGRISFLWIHPMSFGEYLMAIGKEEIYQLILAGKLTEYHAPILDEEVKKFFYIGGMPNAVKAYVETKSFEDVRTIQKEIIETYQSDFPKYSKRLNVKRLTTVFKNIPYHLGKKLIYQHLDQGSKSVEIKRCVELLTMANIIIPSYHSNASAIPLKSTLDTSIIKMFFLEVDFLISFQGKILPIEVKANKGTNLKSLTIFSKEWFFTKTIKEDLTIENWPLYSVEGFIKKVKNL